MPVPNETKTKTKSFLSSSFQLIQLFTEPRWQQKYMAADQFDDADPRFAGCMKSIEFFTTDITTDLQEWSVEGQTSIWYRTSKYWYVFECRTVQGIDLVFMSRFCRRSYRRWDDWANRSSVEGIGRKWLLQPEQRQKFVRLTA
jgi:hypothetical protein